MKDLDKKKLLEKTKNRELTDDEQFYLEMPHPEIEEILQLEQEARDITYHLRKRMNDLSH